jgi:hypothetical protein
MAYHVFLSPQNDAPVCQGSLKEILQVAPTGSSVLVVMPSQHVACLTNVHLEPGNKDTLTLCNILAGGPKLNDKGRTITIGHGTS